MLFENLFRLLRGGTVGVQRDGLPEPLIGLFDPARFERDNSEVEVGKQVFGIPLESLPHVLLRIVKFAQVEITDPHIYLRVGVFRILSKIPRVVADRSIVEPVVVQKVCELKG